METYPEPLRREEFRTNFLACNVFLVEMACQWPVEKPDLELQYNQLSAGEIDDIPERPGSIEEQLEEISPMRRDFTKELRATIHRSKKKIVLERPPVPFLNVEYFNAELMEALRLLGVDAAVALCKHQQQRLATSMVQRDCALVKLITQQLSSGARLFAFRGIAHEPWLCRLLSLHGVRPNSIRFAEEPSLQERLVRPLTIGEQIREADVLRHLYVVLNQRKDEYQEIMTLEKEAQAKSEEEIRTQLAKHVS